MRVVFLLLVLASGQSIAQAPDYVIDGASPGMASGKAKSLGFTKCVESQYNKDVTCRKTDHLKVFSGVPVLSVDAVFSPPYESVKAVVVKFKTVKQTKECRPGPGKWGDVLPSSCVYDLREELSNAFGEPITTRRSVEWHKCGKYKVSLEKESIEITMSDLQTVIDLRKWECEEKNKKRAAADAEKARTSSFIQKMK